MNNIYYVVEILRNDDREQHSYVHGVYNDENLARKEALEHINDRAGKYGAEIHGYEINEGLKKVFLKLDSDIGFSNSLKKSAENIEKIINKGG